MYSVSAIDHTAHSVQNIFPWGIPWDGVNSVFFGVTYSIIGIIGAGLAYTLFLTLRDLKKGGHH